MCFSISLGQSNLEVNTITTENGLHFRHVTSITQDDKGFMWFGTDQGITKYDGKAFTTFDSKKDNPNYIPNEQVSELIYQNSINTLWFVADYKLFSLNLNNLELIAFDSFDALKGEILDIALDKTNKLWLIKDNSTNYKHKIQDLIAYDGKSFKVIKTVERKSTGFTSIDVTNANNICWTTVNQGVMILDQKGNILQHKKLETYDWYGHTIHYGKSFFDSNNTHYYFSESDGGVDVYDDLEFKSRLVDTNKKIDYGIQGKDEGIWFSGDKELFYVNAQNEVIDYTANISEALDFTHINAIFLDFSDLLWLGTDNGLIKIKLQPQNFETILKINDKGWGRTFRDIFPLRNGFIGAMSESDIGIYKIDKNGYAMSLQLPSAKTYLKDARFFVSDTISNKAFTVTNYFVEVDFTNNSITRYNAFSPYLNETKPNPLIKLQDGTLLTGYMLSKLIRIQPEEKSYRPIFDNLPTKEYIVKALHQSKTNPDIVWVGTVSDGLFKVNLNGEIVDRYHVNSMPALSKNHIMSLTEIDDKLLVGTFGGGVCILDQSKNTIRVIDNKNGLADNNVVSIETHNNNEILASTYNGLSRIHLSTGDTYNYFEKDGISNNEFNYTSSFKSEDGYYYFGGMNGITKFSYENLSEERVLPALNFTQLEFFNQQKDTLIKLTSLGDSPIVLSPYDINLKVDWSVPDYFNNEDYSYYTILEGFENDWFYQGNTSSIRYNQLPAGDYILKVRGIDSNGNKSKAGLEIPIVVNQIFYKTWWFILLSILVIGAVVYGIFQYRLKQALAIERLRTKISSELHDDVGSMLTGIAMQTEMLEMQANNEVEKKKLNRLTTLSRNTIAHMRDFVWTIDSRKDKLENLIERMHEYAEEHLLPSGIQFEIKIDRYGLSKKLNPNCRRNLYLIFKEAITNVLKHSNAKNVVISISTKKGSCTFSIKDDGILKVDKTSTGQGLANMKMRSEEINAELQINTLNGFCIDVILPKNILLN